MRRSYFWAAFFALAAGGWLASGHFTSELNGGTPAPQANTGAQREKPEQKLFAVEVQEFKARDRTSSIVARGQTDAAKMIEVRNRTDGIVEKVLIEAGERVKPGKMLCELDRSTKKANLARAKAEMVSAQNDYNSAVELEKQRFQSRNNVATLKARLDAAKATMVQTESEMSWTYITAPTRGVVAESPVEEGSFMQVGQLCARIAIMDPIKITAQVGERDVGFLREGQKAAATLVTGEQLEGTISFISPLSDINTRTFKVEIKAPNPDWSVRSGVTASLQFNLPPSKAHLLPAYLIGLNDAGEVGVRLVDAANTVRFQPVKLIKHTRQGIWVDGLPNVAKLITVGQDYVLDGQKVDVRIVRPGTADAGS